MTVAADAAIRLLGEDLRYVSRGGLKLAAALDHWQIAVAGRACLDVGASTGGFTDCLSAARRSPRDRRRYGFGQIAMKLRNDPRVRLMERTNARLLEPDSLNEADAPVSTLLVMDVSFISATLVLGPVLAAAPHLDEAVVLVKPQFEAGREHVGKGGIVRDPAAHQLAIEKVAECVRSCGWQVVETIPSPITGSGGEPGVSVVRAKAPGTECSLIGAGVPRGTLRSVRSFTLGPHESRRHRQQAPQGRARPDSAAAGRVAEGSRLRAVSRP